MTQDIRNRRRLDRQFRLIERWAPRLRGPLAALRSNRWRLLRLPLALVLVAGGLLSFLPVLGLWMLPLGLLLAAVDLPALRGPVTAGIIRLRRRVAVWWLHRGTRKRA